LTWQVHEFVEEGSIVELVLYHHADFQGLVTASLCQIKHQFGSQLYWQYCAL